ncbi:hypothetical protein RCMOTHERGOOSE_47 [Rhodobacter phage RcMotherGoose]|nr:hypothetical protein RCMOTHERGOOSE_47 [Rhodobacter phage RcMotherGoose]
MKPRIYWIYYPKLRRGFWRVGEYAHRNSKHRPASGSFEPWRFAHRMAEEMNRAVAANGTGRP